MHAVTLKNSSTQKERREGQKTAASSDKKLISIASPGGGRPRRGEADHASILFSVVTVSPPAGSGPPSISK